MRYAKPLLLLTLLASLQGCFPVVATGVGASAMLAADRRTSGIYVEDESIENKVLIEIANKFKSRVHVNATSYNRRVLLTGEVPDAATKEEIGKIAAGAENVREVVDELEVHGISSLSSRGNDTAVTANVKLRFLDSNEFRANHVKVVTERGTTYLLGLVYRKEADIAVDIASGTKGVNKVVKVFEYLD